MKSLARSLKGDPFVRQRVRTPPGSAEIKRSVKNWGSTKHFNPRLAVNA